MNFKLIFILLLLFLLIEIINIYEINKMKKIIFKKGDFNSKEILFVQTQLDAVKILLLEPTSTIYEFFRRETINSIIEIEVKIKFNIRLTEIEVETLNHILKVSLYAHLLPGIIPKRIKYYNFIKNIVNE